MNTRPTQAIPTPVEPEPIHEIKTEIKLLLLAAKYAFLRFETRFNVTCDYAIAAAIRSIRTKIEKTEVQR